jgi:hypothetical protein
VAEEVKLRRKCIGEKEEKNLSTKLKENSNRSSVPTH